MSEFSDWLRKYDRERLERAFDAAKREGRAAGFPQGRYTLTRWVNGVNRPSRVEWVELLAKHLRDDELVEIYREDVPPFAPNEKAIITKFSGLAPDKAALLFEKLTELRYAAEPSARENFRMRIELQPDLTPSCHRLEVKLEWTGALPKDALAGVAPDGDDLDRAFADQRYIFRELIPLDDEEYAAGWLAMEEAPPILTYRSHDRGRNARGVSTTGAVDPNRPGTFAFSNPAISNARIELTVGFPYPSSLYMYPAKFGGYALVGRVKLELRVPRNGHIPNVMTFLSSAKTDRHASPRHVIELTVGDEDTVVPPNSGAVFYWMPNDHGDGAGR